MSIARWNLKEVGGKTPVWGTRTTYKAYACGWVCITKQSPKLSETSGVNVADRWSESNLSYLGRSDRYVVKWILKQQLMQWCRIELSEVSRCHSRLIHQSKGWTLGGFGKVWITRKKYQESRQLLMKTISRMEGWKLQDNGKVRKHSFLRLITEETAKMYMPIILWREFLPETIWTKHTGKW